MPHPAPRHATVDEWVAREAIPFGLDSTGRFDAAVDQMMALLGGSVELLGFGEALHGGEEILVLRNRLFQRLVEAHGYSAIAVESSFPRGPAVNEYVGGRGPASYEAVRDEGFSHGFGRLDANRELVEWMRRHNADAPRGEKLQFYGFDMPGVAGGPASPRQLLHFALDYLASLDGAAARKHRERIGPLLGQDADWENPVAWRDPGKSAGLKSAATALRVETEELISALHVRRPEGAEGDGGRYREAVQHARVARQLLNFYAALAGDPSYAGSLGVRDALMADTLGYVVEREREAGRGKVLAFAHNKHLQRGRAQWQLGPALISWWPAGAHLHAMLGPRYAAMGTAVGVSEDNGIGPPEAGTLEALLTAAAGPARFMPTRNGESLARSASEGLAVR